MGFLCINYTFTNEEKTFENHFFYEEIKRLKKSKNHIVFYLFLDDNAGGISA